MSVSVLEKSNGKFIITFFIIISGFLSSLFAQDFWQESNNGLYGGTVNCITINSSGRIFAGTREGIYFSDDNGSSWIPVNNALTSNYIYCLAVNSSGQVFAGTSSSGIFYSDNNGSSWTAVNNGLTNLSVTCLAISSSGQIFAGTWNGGIFYSDNNGSSWTAVNNGLTNLSVRCLAINSSGQIFTGTDDGGIYFSDNNGSSWTAVNNGLTNLSVRCLAINSTGQIFAGTYCGGIFFSNNNGSSWTKVSTAPVSNCIVCLAINSSKQIFAGTTYGVYFSNNNGTSWVAVNNGLRNMNILSMVINSMGQIFVGTDGGGIYYSKNNGNSWAAINNGLTNVRINCFAVNSSGQIFAGTPGAGIFFSGNDGNSWTAVNNGLLNFEVRSLAINSTGHIFAGVWGDGVFISKNNGSSWALVNNGLTTGVISLAINSSGQIFAGTPGHGIFFSGNSGNSWTTVNNGLTDLYISCLAINNSGQIFVGNYNGIFFSDNNGSSWSAINNGLPEVYIHSLVINNNGQIFAGNYNGIFFSDDNGSSWTAVNNGLTNLGVRCLAINSSGQIFAGTDGSGVFFSDNNGNSWTAVNNGLANLKIMSLTINSSGQVFAGTESSGVLSSIKSSPITPPYCTSQSANNVTTTSARLNGTVNPNYGSTDVTFQYGQTAGYGATVNASPGWLTGSTTQSTNATIADLTPNMPYHFRIVATNSAGTSYGSDQSFITKGIVATPTFDPQPGIYPSAQNVTINCTTSGVTIRYTTNGTDPTTSSTIYNTPVLITSTTTLKARAFKTGLQNSDIADGIYAITGKVATPSFAPLPGTYTTVQNVAIHCTTTNATILYTTDGNNPTISSTVYITPVPITSKTTLKARAFKSNWQDSDIASGLYTITSKVATPTFAPLSGTFTSAQNVTISCATSGARIRYTTNGSDPTLSSTIYITPILISSTTTLKARAFKSDWIDSDIASGLYSITTSKVATPTFTPLSGIFTSAQNVAINCTTTDATIRYTIDGSDPTISSTTYTASLFINSTTTLKARAFKTDWQDSDIATGLYSITGKVATPTFDPLPGVYTSAQYITINCTTTGATIRYTIDNSDPTSSSPVYNTPLLINSTTTLKARAFKTDWQDSDIISGLYVITGKVASPTFEPIPGIYTTAQNIVIYCATTGATIHYTTDGNDPTSSSTISTAPVFINLTTALKARAFKTDWDDSDITSGLYTITGKVATPTFTPLPGTYKTAQNLSMSCATTDATIYYTMDGNDPTSSSTMYTAPVSIAVTTTLKARAFKTDWQDSDIASGNYIININQPPVIVHNPVISFPAGQNLPIDAVLTDDAEGVNAVLCYRQGGEKSFGKFGMVKENNNHFIVSIPSAEVGSHGIDYFIVAYGAGSDSTRIPSSGYYSIQITLADPGVIQPIAQISGSEQTAYRLFSVPIEPDDRNPAALFQDDLGTYDNSKWRLFEFAGTQQYYEYPNISEIIPGHCYWLIVKEAGKRIDSGSGKSINTSREFSIPLYPKYNFIANPFNFAIPVGHVHTASGVMAELRSYQGQWNDVIHNKVTAIESFQGYELANNSTEVDTLYINPNLSDQPSLAKIQKERIDEPDWYIRLSAGCQDARDDDNIMGVSKNAKADWDMMDEAEPPIIGSYISLYFNREEWKKTLTKYCTDIKPDQAKLEWEFNLDSKIDDVIQLTFSEFERVPADREIILIDEIRGIYQNIRQNQHYEVEAGLKNQQLKVLVASAQSLQDELTGYHSLPQGITLKQNYPNPFNTETSIRYSLEKESVVAITIYNVRGEIIRTLLDKAGYLSGYHSVIWDGRDDQGRVVSSGVYVCQLRTNETVLTKKIVVIR